jgi:hypothetical protein
VALAPLLSLPYCSYCKPSIEDKVHLRWISPRDHRYTVVVNIIRPALLIVARTAYVRFDSILPGS